MNKLYEKFSPKRLFFALSTCFALVSVISLLVTRGSVISDLGFGGDGYMDFFNHISYVNDPSRVYFVSGSACFPPLVYLLYLLFNRVMPEGSVVMYDVNVSPTAMLLYIIYVALSSVMFFCAANNFLKLSSKAERFFTFAAIFLSNVFIFGVIERGNSAFLVLIALLYAFAFKDSESKLKREIALILIAVAAGIKVYPAIFGLLYLREKRWKEAGRLIVYGILFFFVPFVFFGGFEGMKQFFYVQSQVHSYPANEIYSIHALFRFLTGAPKEAVGASIAVLAAGIIFISAFFLLPLKKWQQYFILTSAIILLPFWSGYYTVIYLTIPLLAMLNDSEQKVEKTKTDIVFSYIVYALFAVIFSLTIFFEFFSDNMLEFGRFIEYEALYALIFVVLILGIVELVRGIKNGKRKA